MNVILLGIVALGIAIVLIGPVLVGIMRALTETVRAYFRLTGWLKNIRINREIRKRDELLSIENNKLIERDRRLRAYVESLSFEKPLFLTQPVRSVPDSLVARVNSLEMQTYSLELPPKVEMRMFSSGTNHCRASSLAPPSPSKKLLTTLNLNSVSYFLM